MSSQNLGNVQCANRRSTPVEAASHMQKTTGVAGDHGIRIGVLYIVQLARQHRPGYVAHFHREQTAKTAAILGSRQLDQFCVSYLGQQAQRLMGHPFTA